MRICPTCGEENADRARFCQNCATPLTESERPSEVRKVVTIVFADVTGSTALGERLDPEALRRVMGRYFDEMSAVIERHGGTVEKFIGDAVMAVFGIPQLHEDDALRAVRAADGMRTALDTLNHDLERDHGVGLAARIGVNTGEVVAGDPSGGQRLVTGDAVNVAARLEQAAAPGEILLGESTHRLVKDAVEVTPVEPLDLKGKAEPVRASRLDVVLEDTAGHARHLDSAMVGRHKELEMLDHALDRVVTERTSHLFTLLGPAGVGKSRLVWEFVGPGTEATVLRGRCLSYGEGITYFPLVEIVQEAAGVGRTDDLATARSKLATLAEGAEDRDRIVALVAGLLSWGEPVAAEDGQWGVRKLLEHLAHERPLVCVFDDIHWAEPNFLELVEHLADWTRDAPLLLLCVARPELLELRPDWGGGKMNATTILLEPLAGDEVSHLVDNLLGRADIPATARARILEAAEGNPLFVEEMLGMLIDDGLLRFEDGAWRAVEDLAHVTVPPTIQLLLAARLDRLDAEERAVIERGAVEGKVFHAGAVTTLTPEGLRPQVPTRLLALARKELIRPDRAEFAGEDAFRFRHLLIRDAAYRAMPKEQRADLHQRFAEWLEGAAGERLAEYEEILGYHLEQAYRYRAELGSARRGDEGPGALGGRPLDLLGGTSARTGGLRRRGEAPDRRRRDLGRNHPRAIPLRALPDAVREERLPRERGDRPPGDRRRRGGWRSGPRGARGAGAERRPGTARPDAYARADAGLGRRGAATFAEPRATTPGSSRQPSPSAGWPSTTDAARAASRSPTSSSSMPASSRTQRGERSPWIVSCAGTSDPRRWTRPCGSTSERSRSSRTASSRKPCSGRSTRPCSRCKARTRSSASSRSASTA